MSRQKRVRKAKMKRKQARAYQAMARRIQKGVLYIPVCVTIEFVEEDS
jgi:hypothetical protein